MSFSPKRFLKKSLPAIKQRPLLLSLALLVVLGLVATTSALVIYSKPAKVLINHKTPKVMTIAVHNPTKTSVTSNMPTPVPAAAPTTVPAVPTTPNNTAQCNATLAAGEADLNSLNTQINQQLAIMKSITGNSGIDSSIDGGGVNGIVGQSETSESFNQASNEASTLTNQVGTDRQNYVNQLENLQCWTQADAMLSYNPSSQ